MSSDELKPCPFCGGAASLRLYYGGRYRVLCNECGCLRDRLFDTEAEAISYWNRRPKHVVGELAVNIHPIETAPSINVLLARFGYAYAATTNPVEMVVLVDECADRIREAMRDE